MAKIFGAGAAKTTNAGDFSKTTLVMRLYAACRNGRLFAASSKLSWKPSPSASTPSSSFASGANVGLERAWTCVTRLDRIYILLSSAPSPHQIRLASPRACAHRPSLPKEAMNTLPLKMVRTMGRTNSLPHRLRPHTDHRRSSCRLRPSRSTTPPLAHLKKGLPLRQPQQLHLPHKRGKTNMWLPHRANRPMRLSPSRAPMLPL